ncbi:MAG TPA: Gfo/Idh/MocA family oxidoreductase, partial [Gemmatimonadaceae bacterium]|nr:Gfo/Idh/MocA family oxidoreductase [Gemmatimonadaceae bacterium]
MNKQNRLSVLVVGCGAAANLHSKLLRKHGSVKLSFASRDGARSSEMCRKFDGYRAFGSYESGIADDSIDIVLVTTPTATHFELAMQALDAGRHVIVEKPAFMSSSEADLVSAAAERAGKRVMVAENYFYKPIARYLREVIGSGELGDIRFVTIDATKRQKATGWRADPALSGGGALFEGGVHWISFASNLGLEVAGLEAFCTGGEPGNDRSSLVILRYSSGAVGTIAHSWELAAPFGHVRRSRVQGTAGSVTFESNGLLRFTSGRRMSLAFPVLHDALGYRGMLADFLDAIREDREPQFTLALARRDLVFLEEAARSMRRDNVRPVRGSHTYSSDLSASYRDVEQNPNEERACRSTGTRYASRKSHAPDDNNNCGLGRDSLPRLLHPRL